MTAPPPRCLTEVHVHIHIHIQMRVREHAWTCLHGHTRRPDHVHEHPCSVLVRANPGRAEPRCRRARLPCARDHMCEHLCVALRRGAHAHAAARHAVCAFSSTQHQKTPQISTKSHHLTSAWQPSAHYCTHAAQMRGATNTQPAGHRAIVGAGAPRGTTGSARCQIQRQPQTRLLPIGSRLRNLSWPICWQFPPRRGETRTPTHVLL